MLDLTQPDLVSGIFHLLKDAGCRAFNVRQWNAIVKAANEILAELHKPHLPATPGMGLMAWLDCDETGRSSQYLASVLAPLAGSCRPWWPDNYYPCDPADFGRCVGLLKAAPELRPHLPAMATGHGPQWAALAGAWEELEALYAEELPTGKAPKLYARMRELIEAVKPAPPA